MAYIEDIDGPYPTLTVADREVAFARFRAEQEGVLRMFVPDLDKIPGMLEDENLCSCPEDLGQCVHCQEMRLGL